MDRAHDYSSQTKAMNKLPYDFYNASKSHFSVSEPQNKIGLVDGCAAWILYFYNLHKVFGAQQDDKLVDDLLTRCMDFLNSSYSTLSMTYDSGLAGFALTLDYLCDENYLDKADCLDVMTQFNSCIITEVKRQSSIGNFDLFNGSLGMVQYLVNQSHEDLGWLQMFVDSLRISLKESRFGKAWTTIKTEAGQTREYINLGLPHGILGILAVLVRIKERNLCDVDDMILGSINTLNSVRQAKLSTEYVYPCFISTDDELKVKSTLAWCYGDLITGYILLKTAKSLSDDLLAKSAVELLTSCVNRKNLYNDDVSLCHGYMSASLLFKKSFEITGDDQFLHASHYWKTMTINTLRQYEITGLPRFMKGTNQRSSLFYGIAGVNLAILATEFDQASGWEEVMLL